MDLLRFAFLALLMTAARAENLASCAKTRCPAGKECRIVERCWKTDCQVGTTCLDVEVSSLSLSNTSCEFDSPLLRSVDGAPLLELECGGMTGTVCPAGTMCQEPAGVCCTGEAKTEAGSCPLPVSSQFFKVRGECTSFCRHDQECPGFQRCCQTGLGCNACMDPEPRRTCERYLCDPGTHCVMQANTCTTYPCLASPTCTPDKTGACPALTPRAGCLSECKVDSHCPGDLKCCTAGDCGVCVTPSSSASPLAPSSSSLSSSPSSSTSPITSSLQLAAGGLGPAVPTSSLSLASAGTSNTMLDSSSFTLPGSATSDLTGATSLMDSTSGASSGFGSLTSGATSGSAPSLGSAASTWSGSTPAPSQQQANTGSSGGASSATAGTGTYDLMTQWKNLLTGTSGGTFGSPASTGGSSSTVAGSTNPFGSMFPTMGSAGAFGTGALSFNTLMQNAQKLMSSIQQGANPLTLPSTSSSSNIVQGSGTEATSGNMPTLNNIISAYGTGSPGTNSLYNGGGSAGAQASTGGGMMNQFFPVKQQLPSYASGAAGSSSLPQQTAGGFKCGMSCMMMFAMIPS